MAGDTVRHMGRGPRNHRPDLNGVLVIDKPLGLSSAAVCRAVRRATGGAKVGHAGTLDPLASGVLVVCLGKATKAVDRLMAGEKAYRAEVDLAAFSTTDDMEGEATPVTPRTTPDLGAIERACAAMVGEVMQSPPAFSAVHIDGERAYRMARRGELEASVDAPPLPARPVVIHAIEALSYEWPALSIDVRCGKGTYIRSIARDLGRALGTGGRLSGLRRTRVGPYTIDDAITMEALERFEPAMLREAPGEPG